MTRPRTLGVALLAAVVCLAVADAAGGAPAPSTDAVALENDRLALVLDPHSGAIRSIRDKRLVVVYRQSGVGWEMAVDGATLRAGDAVAVERRPDGVVFRFESGVYTVGLHYRLGRDDAFVEKWLVVRPKHGRAYQVREICLEDASFDAEIREIHLHDDQTRWHCPINLFLRGERGGLYAGLEYPYWKLDRRGRGGFRLAFAPDYAAAAGETFTSEKYFIGAYRYEGIYRYSHGPYPGDRRPALVTFQNSSVSHYQDTSDVAEEVLDWGEVWAMQEFMRRVLPEHLLPDDGYYTWVNSWWAWAWNPQWSLNEGAIDLLASLGIGDVMTQSIWFGHGQHPMPVEYVARMDPAKTAAFSAAASLEPLIAYGRRKGVRVTSFCCPGVYFDARPEWLSLTRDGRPTHYNVWSKVSCPGCDDYMAFMLQLYDRMFAAYGCRWWGFDGRWLGYCEFPQEDGRPIGPDPCYSTRHRHAPGDSAYREWRNINRLLEELRRRRPRMCLETYYGLKAAGPWVLRHLNATENYYEEAGSDQMRFQLWHNRNDRFFPLDRNMTTLFARDAPSFQYGLLSMLAGGPYGQVGPGLHQLVHPQNQAFFRKWRDWANRNIAYLRARRDLFACPGYSRVDGSAQMIDDRGYLFLFPTGLHPNSHTPENDEGIRAAVARFAKVVRASIALNRRLGLREAPAATYEVVELYPREGRPLGTYRYGQTLLYDMPKDSAVVLAVSPAEGRQVASAGFDPGAREVHVVPAFQQGALSTPEFLALDGPGRVAAVWARSGFDAAPQNFNTVDGVAAKELSFPPPPGKEHAAELGDLRLRAPATFAAWVWRNDAIADRRLVSQLAGPVEQAGSLRFAERQLQLWDGRRWQTLIAGGLDAKTWLHVAVVFNKDGNATGYVNGRPQATAASRCDFRGVPAGIGAKFLGQHGEPFAGRIRDFAVRRQALSPGEVRQLANKRPTDTPR